MATGQINKIERSNQGYLVSVQVDTTTMHTLTLEFEVKVQHLGEAPDAARLALRALGVELVEAFDRAGSLP